MLRCFSKKFKFGTHPPASQKTKFSYLLGVNAIINRAYHHQGQGVLTDQIRLELKNLKTFEGFEQKVADDLEEYFDPQKGMEIDSGFYDQKRIQIGKGISSLFPIHPTWLMNLFLRQLYINKVQNGQEGLYLRQKGERVLYMVGTPGLGKSSTWISIKKLHDKRIPFLINHGCPQNSPIKTQLKIFYMHALASKQKMMEKIYQQIVEDFGTDQPELNYLLDKYQKNPKDWLEKVQLKYLCKKIRVKFVVDQFNSLYKLEDYSKQVQLWSAAITYSQPPLFVIASKNNIVPTQQDPMNRIADQSNDMTKLQIDNTLQSPKQSLLYTIDCLLFQLQKQKVSRKNAYEVIKNLKRIPIMTHLKCRQIVSHFNLLNETQIKDTNFLVTQLSKKFSQTTYFDQIRMTNNIADIFNKLTLTYSVNNTLSHLLIDVLEFIMSFISNFKKIKTTVKIQYEGCEIEKELEIAYMLVNSFQLPNQEQLISNLPNFLYVSSQKTFLSNKSAQFQRNSSQKVVYSFLPPSELQKIDCQHYGKMYSESIQKLKNNLGQYKFGQFCEKSKGLILEAAIYNIITSKQLNPVFMKIQHGKQLFQISFAGGEYCTLKMTPKSGNNKEKLTWTNNQIKIFSQKLRGVGICYKMRKSNAKFDFIVGQKISNQLQILIVDTTTLQDQQQLYEKMESLRQIELNPNLMQVLKDCATDSKIQSINLHLCVLKAYTGGEYIQKSKPYCFFRREESLLTKQKLSKQDTSQSAGAHDGKRVGQLKKGSRNNEQIQLLLKKLRVSSSISIFGEQFTIPPS